MLDKKIIDVNPINVHFNTPLIYSCYNPSENVALKLLEFDNIDYNHKNLGGDTALNIACELKKKKVALKLLEKPNINYNEISLEYIEI